MSNKWIIKAGTKFIAEDGTEGVFEADTDADDCFYFAQKEGEYSLYVVGGKDVIISYAEENR